jgi:hypothetical protein
MSVITYQQLLALAHDRGLHSILTEVIEVREGFAFFRAVVTMEDGKVFTGHGDAATNNVKPAMVNCLPRMAETRAKARALRDAVNIGEVSAEELPDYEERPASAPPAAAARPRSVRQPAAPQIDANGPLSRDQANAIRNICDRKRVDADGTAREQFGVPVSELSGSQAQQLIRDLQATGRVAA